MFKDAMWLVKKEYQYQWRALVASFTASLLIGLFVGIVLAGSSDRGFDDLSIDMNHFMADLIIFGMVPGFGTFFMARPYLSYRNAKENPYGRRMAVLRSLPIPVSVLSLSRMILMVTTLLIMSAAFMGMIGVALFIMTNSHFSTDEFFIFALTWFGFALAVGGINPCIEYGMTGKMIHIIPFIYIGLLVIIELILKVYGIGIVETVFQSANHIGWPLAFLSIVFGALCLVGWNQLLKKRLVNRDYL
ncbi:hypothetical protein EDD68_107121 [Melghiribacillus thermohalophilus]|uniref:ABC-2 type transport system permease protein n=1 Tax=Melghiribacillus thermohalophilus TaxID=1324956 RepID=A0A4R3N4T6_9BACI|nr:hypothetical protein [Melghiribacillus thermohalophilus]TCT23407.1 hypothetical protein EDD68_107121 [Melghiribacillus thermohalophilus]